MMTLKRLLKWAKKEGLYIEIYADGSAMVENETEEGFGFLAEGLDLRSALKAAKRKYDKWPSLLGKMK